MTRSKASRGVPDRVWYALCFFVPVAVLTAVYALEGFYPFGEKSILVSDLSQQYVEFFCGLKQGDVFFSWSKGLGSSYVGVFSYYLPSPLSLLTLLVPNEAMPLGLMVLTLLKLGLAGLSYGVFARHVFGALDAAGFLCAVCYALCAYGVGYSLCVMWLDGMIWLPVILLGVEWVLQGRRRWVLPCALAVCFVSTWYISYMIGGFALLWFLFRAVALGIKGKELLVRCRDFLLAALWALCLTAWLWLPSLLALADGKLAAAGSAYDGLFNFGLAELGLQLLFGHHQFFSNAALPYVFCGTLTLPAAGAYFFLRSVPLRTRLAAAGVAAAVVLSMWLAPLDRVWHLFQRPNWFPYRYAFVLSFLLVFLANHTLARLGRALKPGRPAVAALAVLVCWEMGANAAHILRTVDAAEPYQPYEVYTADCAANAALVRRAKELDGSFFRMGATYDRGLNGPLAFGYPGITHYSSFYNARLNAALSRLGLAQAWYWCAYYGASPFTDALLGVKYVITDRAVPGYDLLGQAGGLGLYRAPAVLPLAFSARAVPGAEGAAAGLQNRLFSDLTGLDEPLFAPAESRWESHDGWTVLTLFGTGRPIYLDLRDGAVTDLQLDGQSLFRYPAHTGKTRCLHGVGAPAAGESVTVVVTHDGAWSPEGVCWYFDSGLLARGVASLQNTTVEAVRNAGASFTVRSGGGPLLTTIPAEDGWQVRVDGERAELKTWLDGAFWYVDLAAGDHAVTFRYTPPGLWPGLGLGALALLAAGGQWLWRKKRKTA